MAIKKKSILSLNKLAVYQVASGALELRKDVKHETVWATQAQIAQIFGIERSVITKHIGKLLTDKQIDEKSNVQKMHIANSDKPVTLYSLDIILGVGYRTNSAKAIEFRQWATKTLRQHITQGYTINRRRIAYNYDAFVKSVADIQALLPAGTYLDTQNILNLVKEFANTWMSIDAYDKEALAVRGTSKKIITLTSDELVEALATLKKKLMHDDTATNMFALERFDGAVQGIVGNVMQRFGGKAVYTTLEEKAEHLLYFMIKNHPFTDGNNRSGAFAFVWFLRRYGVRGARNFNHSALTALTLLIAISDPKQKDQMVALTTQLLQ